MGPAQIKIGMNAFLPWDVNALWQSLDPTLMRRRRILTSFNIACIYDSKILSLIISLAKIGIARMTESSSFRVSGYSYRATPVQIFSECIYIFEIGQYEAYKPLPQLSHRS